MPVRIRIPKKEPEKQGAGKQYLAHLSTIVGIIISVATFYFGLVQYFYSENLIDRRKYYNQYYEERYRVLKELCAAAAKINNEIMFLNDASEMSKSKVDTIRSQLKFFNYANYALYGASKDSIIRGLIEKYRDFVIRSTKKEQFSLDLVDSIYFAQREILQEAGKTFAHEKDSINSFTFEFNPFGSH